MSKCGKCEFEENHDCEFLMENGICSEKYEVSFCAFQIRETNAGKIRSMSDKELAEFIQDVQCDNHGYFVDKLLSKSANPICILEMLKREVSE